LLFALAEMTSAIQTPLGYTKAISAWFDPRRGLALGIALAGVRLGGAVIPQLANALIERVGLARVYPVKREAELGFAVEPAAAVSQFENRQEPKAR
jgi:hypothetical protein